MRGRAARAALPAAVLLAAAGTLALQAASAASPWVKEWLERTVATAFGGTLRLGGLRLDATGLRAEVTDLELTVPAGDAPPLRLRVPSGTLKIDWTAVPGMAGGRVTISEASLRDPEIWMSSEFFRARPARKGGKGAIDFRIERAEVTGGRLHFDDLAHAFRLDARDIAASGTWSSARRMLVGEVRTAATLEHRPFTRPVPVEARSGFRFRLGRLELIDAVGELPFGHAEANLGFLFGGGFSMTGDGRARCDLAELHRWFDPASLPLAGAVDGTVRLDLRDGVLGIGGLASASALRVGPIEADSAAARYAFRGRSLELDGFDAQAYGGRVRGRVGVDFLPVVRFRTAVDAEGVDLQRLLLLPGLHLPVASALTGSFSVEGEPARPATWTGEGRLQGTALSAAGDRVPAAMGGTIRFGEGHFRLQSSRVELAGATFSLGVDADLSRKPVRAIVGIEGETRDARRTQVATLRVMRALGVPTVDLLGLPLEGNGSIRTRVALGGEPDVDVDLDLREGSWDGSRFDVASVGLALRGKRLEMSRVRLARGEETIQGSAAVTLEPFAIERAEATLNKVALERFLRRAGVAVDLDGDFTGDVKLQREGGGLRGEGRAVLTDAVLYGEAIGRAETPWTLADGRLDLSEVAATGPAVEAKGRVVVDVDTWETQVVLARGLLRIGALEKVKGLPVPLSGDAQLSGALVWRKDGPEGEMRVALSGLRGVVGGVTLDQSMVGEVEGSLVIHPGELEARIRGIEDDAWELEARLGLSEEMPFTARLKFTTLEAATEMDGRRPFALRLGGELRVSGPLSDPKRLELEADLNRAALRLGTKDVAATAPVVLRLRSQRFVVEPVRFQGETSVVEAALEYRLDTGHVEGFLRGEVDLALLALFWREVRAAGPVEADLSWNGTVGAPGLTGTIRVDAGRFRLLGFPLALDGLSAAASIDATRLKLERVRAISGGGEVRGSGTVDVAAGRLASYRGELRLSNVRLEFPAGFKGTYDGEVRLEGSAERGEISGRLDLLHGLYDREFDLLNFVGSGSRAQAVSEESGIPRNIALNVDISAGGNVLVRNNLARLEAGVALNVGGELRKPELTGRIWLMEGGRIRFQEVDYRIVTGSVDFTERDRIDPYFDVRARTTVQRYEINLHVEGKTSKLEYDLTSNPALGQQDIVTLLLTGSIPETATGAEGGAGSSANVASNYFAGLLTGRVGGQLRKNLGLDRFEISPLLVQSASDPTTRISVGKEVTQGVNVLYSTEIGGTERQTYQIDWEATKKIRLWAQSDTKSGVSGEFQYTTRLNWGRKAKVEAAPSPEAKAEPAAEPSQESRRVTSVTITGIPEDEAKKLVDSLPLRTGEPFARTKMFEGSEALRKRFVRNSRIEAVVTAKAAAVDGESADRAVEYAIAPGPEVTIEVEGVGRKDRRRITKTLSRFWLDYGYSADRYAEAEDSILQDLQSRGYYAADVWHDHAGSGDSKIVRFHVERGEAVRVARVDIDGVVGISEDEIRSVMALQQGKPKKRILKPALLDQDVGLIRALYRSKGYAEVRVGRPAIRLSATGDSAGVSIVVAEGPRFLIEAVEVPNDLEVPRETLLEWSALRPGDVFSTVVLGASEAAILSRLDAAGYPSAKVESSARLEGGRATVAFGITPGDFKRVEDVEIRGNDRTKERIIRRDIEVKAGDPLSRNELLVSQRALYRLGLFNRIRTDYTPVGGADPSLQKVTFKVDEAPPIALSFGLGYDAEGSPRGSFSISDDNVGGYDRNIAFQGVASKFLQRLQLSAVEPRLFNRRRLEGLASLFREREVDTGFTVDRVATVFRIQRKLPDRTWTRWIRYYYQRVNLSDVTDPAALEQEQLENLKLGDVGGALIRDLRDDPFLPRRGGYGRIELRVFSPIFLSEESFVKLFLQSSYTKTFSPEIAYAAALRLGTAWPYGATTTIPISERYFAGGANTIRGFPRDYVGPISENGQPLGGNALLLLNQELRVPIWKIFKAVGFMDVGNVYSTVQEIDLRALRYTAGTGLRLELPVGPLRLEYAWKLDPIEGESPGEWVFAIGSIF